MGKKGRPIKARIKYCKKHGCGKLAAKGQVYCSAECAPYGNYGKSNQK